MKNLRKLHLASKQHSQRKKGSKSKEQSRIALACIHRKNADIRPSFPWKLAHILTDGYDDICLGPLDIQRMKRSWRQNLSGLDLSDFISIFSYLSVKIGKGLLKIEQFELSTKKCSTLGRISKAKKTPLKACQEKCPERGSFHDHDPDTASNVLVMRNHRELGHRLSVERTQELHSR